MKKLFWQIIAGILGIWLATKIIPNVEFTGGFLLLILVGILLGLINFFIKPLLKLITLPLYLLTFGFFGFIINIFLVWAVDLIFPELIIPGIISLVLATLIIWIISLVFSWI
jgi:putative membrane protein